MSSDLFEIILPSFACFLVFFSLSILLEIGVVLLLNRLFFRHWIFMVKIACVPQEKWHRHAEFAICLLFSFSLLALVVLTHAIEVFLSSGWEIKIYALELFLATLLIYRLTSRMLPENACDNCQQFLRKIHQYLFFFTASLIALFSILTIDRHYDVFKKLVHATLVYPTTGEQRLTLEEKTKNRLVATFRHQIYQSLCPRTDYSTCTANGPINMVYVTTHSDLRINRLPINRHDPKDYLSGRACTEGDITFLLTDHGQWYWVIDESKIVKESEKKVN